MEDAGQPQLRQTLQVQSHCAALKSKGMADPDQIG
jgi:hypothetical protein